MKSLSLILALTLVLFTNEARAQVCSDSSQISGYVNCVLNDGYGFCGTQYTSCDYFGYYIDPGFPISNMINLCCGNPTDETRKTCFKKERKKIVRAKSLGIKFRNEVKSRVNAYINNPEVFCTEA